MDQIRLRLQQVELRAEAVAREQEAIRQGLEQLRQQVDDTRTRVQEAGRGIDQLTFEARTADLLMFAADAYDGPDAPQTPREKQQWAASQFCQMSRARLIDSDDEHDLDSNPVARFGPASDWWAGLGLPEDEQQDLHLCVCDKVDTASSAGVTRAQCQKLLDTSEWCKSHCCNPQHVRRVALALMQLLPAP